MTTNRRMSSQSCHNLLPRQQRKHKSPRLKNPRFRWRISTFASKGGVDELKRQLDELFQSTERLVSFTSASHDAKKLLEAKKAVKEAIKRLHDQELLLDEAFEGLL